MGIHRWINARPEQPMVGPLSAWSKSINYTQNCLFQNLWHRLRMIGIDMAPPDRVRLVKERLPADGLFSEKVRRIATQPLALGRQHVQLLEKLGLVLHHFNHACNNLYRQSVAGKIHPWVAPLLDFGKPPELVAIARHDKTKGHVPAVIAPDLILTEEGFAMAGLDPVPTEIGLAAWLGETYSALGYPVLGSAGGVRSGFLTILKQGRVLISENAAMYRPEIEWLAGKQSVDSVENYLPDDRPSYRFFEAFDYLNLSQFRQGWQAGMPLTPPLKPYLEEKLWLALFWSRPLQEFWRQEIGENGQRLLQKILPYSWVLDPTPLPHHAAVPELGIQNWIGLEKLSLEQRQELVLKISRFSLLAPNDINLTAAGWAEQVRLGLAEFRESPRILTRLTKGLRVEQEFGEGGDLSTVQTLEGRVKISPYYFVVQDRVTLGGVLSTLSPDQAGDPIFAPVIPRA